MEEKTYSIKDFSKLFHLPASTIRYYDSLGFFPHLEHKFGKRIFRQQEVERMNEIVCLKNMDFSIHEMKEYLLNKDVTSLDLNRFILLKKHQYYLEAEIERMQNILKVITHKCHKYENG